MLSHRAIDKQANAQNQRQSTKLVARLSLRLSTNDKSQDE